MPFYNLQIESTRHTEEVKEAIMEACDCAQADGEARMVITASITAF